MINPRKFALLGTKQKIYKIASSIRNIENTVKNGGKVDFKEVLAYTQVLSMQEGIKVQKALTIIESLQQTDLKPLKEQIKDLNFAYHDLLGILGEQVIEDKKFSLIQFDHLHKEPTRYPWIAILDNLRSPMNVGSIIRSADGFGAGELFLTGITPHPPNSKITKTALGAEDFVPIRYFSTTEDAILTARKEEYRIIALEIVEPVKMLSELDSLDHCAFVFGNEEFGITESVLDLCDDIVQLPLVGKKNSINVGHVFSIVAYNLFQYYSNKIN